MSVLRSMWFIYRLLFYMLWYGMVWYMICDMVWYDMIWYGMVWYDILYDMIWYERMIWYDMIWYDMIWYDIFVNCKWLPPGGSSTVHIYTQTVHRTTQNKQYIEQHKIWAQQKIWKQYKKFGRMRVVPRLGELYTGICLTTEEEARKNLSQGSRTIRIHKPNNKNT
jgi:hypothetical protein